MRAPATLSDVSERGLDGKVVLNHFYSVKVTTGPPRQC
jgi:hypothetical protein